MIFKKKTKKKTTIGMWIHGNTNTRTWITWKFSLLTEAKNQLFVLLNPTINIKESQERLIHQKQKHFYKGQRTKQLTQPNSLLL